MPTGRLTDGPCLARAAHLATTLTPPAMTHLTLHSAPSSCSCRTVYRACTSMKRPCGRSAQYGPIVSSAPRTCKLSPPMLVSGSVVASTDTSQRPQTTRLAPTGEAAEAAHLHWSWALAENNGPLLGRRGPLSTLRFLRATRNTRAASGSSSRCAAWRAPPSRAGERARARCPAPCRLPAACGCGRRRCRSAGSRRSARGG